MLTDRAVTMWTTSRRNRMDRFMHAVAYPHLVTAMRPLALGKIARAHCFTDHGGAPHTFTALLTGSEVTTSSHIIHTDSFGCCIPRNYRFRMLPVIRYLRIFLLRLRDSTVLRYL